jgi:hypothetical protein
MLSKRLLQRKEDKVSALFDKFLLKMEGLKECLFLCSVALN